MEPMDELKQYLDTQINMLEAEIANHKFINAGLPVVFQAIGLVTEQEAVLSKLVEVREKVRGICDKLTKE